MIKDILVVGSGSAGLLVALTLNKRLSPRVNVRIVRDPDIGVIGVGEGTTPVLGRLMFNDIGLTPKRFYKLAKPTWKLGIKFNWGSRGQFFYSFMPQVDTKWPDLSMANGYYCKDNFSNVEIASALMKADKAFARKPDGSPDMGIGHAYHIENELFVDMLEKIALEEGIEFIDGKVKGCERDEHGISDLHLEDGRKLEADLFIDCSGFSSELIGKALEEPFIDFKDTLFCDRAVVGGWDRSNEPIYPYTTADQMSTGWSWRIEHEHRINRGYVYCSDMLSDEEAAKEFRAKNPKLPDDMRIVKFRSGCHRRMWVDNVIAIGNSGGFVEPIEATALAIVSSNSRMLVDFLMHSHFKPTQSLRDLYNKITNENWEDIRNFLGLHYKLNTALNSPFWKRCREETNLTGIQHLLDFYNENGPSGFCQLVHKTTLQDFGTDGYLVMLVGQDVSYKNMIKPPMSEQRIWKAKQKQFAKTAREGFTVEEALSYVRRSA